MSYNSKYTGAQVDGLLERMENLQVGGRNHYHEGLGMICMCPDGTYASPVRTETGFLMHTGLTSLTAIHTVRISHAIDGNGWWTVSFDLSTGNNSTSSRAAATIDVCDGDKSDTFEASGTEVVHCVFSVMVNNYTEAVYNFVDIEIAGRTSVPEVSNLMVERGNMASEYEPAPEDMVSASAGKALEERLDALEAWKGQWPFFCVPLRNITKGAATPDISQMTEGFMAVYWITQASNGTPTVGGTSSTPVYGHYGYMLSVSESTVMLGNRTTLKVSVGPMNDYGNGFQVLTTTGTDVTDQYVLNGIIFGTK